ncbi:MAG: PKD domain-containing protein [Flavobacteriales bacterium]
MATHIVGGEIYYAYTGVNADGSRNYTITLFVYRDCGPTNSNNTPFDEFASIGVFDLSNNSLELDMDVELFNSNVEFVPIELENPCFILPPDLCVQKARYTTNITLQPNNDGYMLVYQRCCRNPSIINLINPQWAGATFTTTIPGFDVLPEGVNSSATYNNFPPVALCAGAEFFFDHSASDVDGDSLSYEFCTPFHGASADDPAPDTPAPPPYANVQWATGYDETYQIASNPPFEIDPVTGFITGTANQIGQYVIGVCVTEWRDGVPINTTSRDFQFNVTLCDPNIIATIPEQTSFCDGMTVEFGNISTNATFFEWDFGVPGIDTDVSTEQNPSYTYTEQGDYTIMLIANPGWPCADTAITTFDVRNPIDPEINFDGAECINNSVRYDFSSNANLTPQATFTWDFGPGAVPATSTATAPNNILLNPELSSYVINVQIEDDGCFDEATLEIDNVPEPISSIVPQESFCAGLTYTFENSSQNTTDFSWNFGAPGNGDISFNPSPEYTFPDTGLYVIRLISSAPNTCPDTAFLSFEIYDLLNPGFQDYGPMCFDVNEYDFTATGFTTNEATFFWDFGDAANLPTTTLQNPQNITFNAPGTYPISLTINENDCERTYEDELWVVAVPTIDAIVTGGEGCAPLRVSFDAQAESETQVFYDWDFGDGGTSTVANPTYIYENQGFYDVSLHAFTTTGCIRNLFVTLNDAVVVLPKPIASFEVSPDELNILHPEIFVQNTSEHAVTCYYYISDGTSYETFDFTHSFIEADITI